MSGNASEQENATMTTTPDPPSAPRAGHGDGKVRTLEARHLLGAGRMVRIDHDGEVYTLRLTRNNKLILTK